MNGRIAKQTAYHRPPPGPTDANAHTRPLARGAPGLPQDDRSAVPAARTQADSTPAALPSPRTPSRTPPGDPAMPPTPQSQALRALRVQVDEVPGLSEPRRRELLAALAQLEFDLVQSAPPERGTVYVMEGATGVDRASGRASTDPDENMALKARVASWERATATCSSKAAQRPRGKTYASSSRPTTTLQKPARSTTRSPASTPSLSWATPT